MPAPGVVLSCVGGDLARVGVEDRGTSGSARRMNCNGVNGDPWTAGDPECIERGLRPRKGDVKVGRDGGDREPLKPFLGSGVEGGRMGGDAFSSTLGLPSS